MANHAVSASSRNSIDQGMSDIEVLASTTVWICFPRVAFLGTSINVVPVKEGKTHILAKLINITVKTKGKEAYSWRIIGSIGWTKDKLVARGIDYVNKSLARITAALLYEGQRSRSSLRLLTAKVGFLCGGVNISVECTFQIGMFTESKIKEEVI